MKKFAALFAAAICMVVFTANESNAQCGGYGYGGGFYGGSGFGISINSGGFYRPSYGFHYGHARPYYGYRPVYRPVYRPHYHHHHYRHYGHRHYGYPGYRGGGVSIRW